LSCEVGQLFFLLKILLSSLFNHIFFTSLIAFLKVHYDIKSWNLAAGKKGSWSFAFAFIIKAQVWKWHVWEKVQGWKYLRVLVVWCSITKLCMNDQRRCNQYRKVKGPELLWWRDELFCPYPPVHKPYLPHIPWSPRPRDPIFIRLLQVFSVQ